MKLFVIALAVSLSQVFASEIVLNQKQINIGQLPQESGAPAFHEFFITRDEKSPKKVEVNFSFLYAQDVCVEFDQRWICRDEPQTVCFPSPTTPDCRTVWRRVCGYETFCARTEQKIQSHKEEIVLDFSLAATLKGETEQFKVTIDQKNYTSRVKLSGEVVNASAEYEISGRGVLAKKGLFFKEKTNEQY